MKISMLIGSGVALALFTSVPSNGATPESVFGYELATWIENKTNYDVQNREVRAVDSFSIPIREPWLAYVPYDGDYTEIINPYGSMVRDFAIYRGSKPWSRFALRMVLHEMLHHSWESQGISNPTEDDVYLEEGITEAMAIDLWPSFVYHFTGRKVKPLPIATYDSEVNSIRWSSVYATGKSWNSYEARVWRRDLWRASPSKRREMIAVAINRKG